MAIMHYLKERPTWGLTLLVLVCLFGPDDAQTEPGQESQLLTDRFGDPLPTGAVARLGTVRFRTGFLMYQVGFWPDGNFVAGASAGGGVGVWDVATGKEAHHYLGNRHVYAFAISPDGKSLACPQRKIHLYDVATGKELRQLEGHGGGKTMTLTFSPDSKTLASGGHDSLVRLWDPVTGTEIRKFEGHAKTVYGLSFSPDGATLASYSLDKTIRFWNVQTGKQLAVLGDLGDKFRTATFSPDGKLLATGSEEGTIHIWNRSSLKSFRVIEAGDDAASALAFTPDGKTLASGNGDGTLALWQVATGKLIQRWRAHAFMVKTVAFSPNGSTLVSGCAYDCGARLWDAVTGKELHAFAGHRGLVDTLVYAADGKELISGSRDKVLLRWDLASNEAKPLLDWQSYGLERFALSPDRKSLAMCQWYNGAIRLWNPIGQGEPRLLGKFEGQRAGLAIAPVAFSPDSKRLTSICRDGVLRTWDVTSGATLWENKLIQEQLSAVLLSPDGKILATGAKTSAHSTLRLLNAATGKEIRAFENRGEVDALAFSPNGKILASASGGQDRAQLWDVATGKVLRPLDGLQNAGYGLSFSPDGRFLSASGADNDQIVHVWEVATGQEVRRFSGHPNGAMTVAFAPDGRTLASGGADSTILIWDVTGRLKNGRLQPVQLSAENLEQCWRNLGGSDGPRAIQAVWYLASSPQAAVPFLKDKLMPVQPGDEARFAQLIADLDANRFTVRKKATEELQALVDFAEPALRKQLAGNPSLEVRQRLEQILAKLEPATSPERVRALRAVQSLEYAGTVQAKRLLKSWADGAPAAFLSRESKTALDRLR